MHLDRPAQGDTIVDVTSSDSIVVVQNATVMDGETSADVLVTVVAQGTVELTFTLGTQQLHATLTTASATGT